ncbi:hypothetical protein JOB18_033395 [Solea senegalensis]|uniref:Uncharacterized protein n=1 Tax=Solea senegalensis TaxID=28829 RepID=A0AAV6S9G6_SOLSE|nr:hypothetical protein JOB18_033395 [Solea senegalensis]
MPVQGSPLPDTIAPCKPPSPWSSTILQGALSSPLMEPETPLSLGNSLLTAAVGITQCADLNTPESFHCTANSGRGCLGGRELEPLVRKGEMKCP